MGIHRVSWSLAFRQRLQNLATIRSRARYAHQCCNAAENNVLKDIAAHGAGGNRVAIHIDSSDVESHPRPASALAKVLVDAGFYLPRRHRPIRAVAIIILDFRAGHSHELELYEYRAARANEMGLGTMNHEGHEGTGRKTGNTMPSRSFVSFVVHALGVSYETDPLWANPQLGLMECFRARLPGGGVPDSLCLVSNYEQHGGVSRLYQQSMAANSTLLCIHRDPGQLSPLRGNGYELITATNGSDGLRVLMLNPVDAVVIEYYLGLLDGAVVADEIKRVKPQLPIVMVADYLELPVDSLKSVDALVSQVRWPLLPAGDHPVYIANQATSATRRKRAQSHPTRFTRYLPAPTVHSIGCKLILERALGRHPERDCPLLTLICCFPAACISAACRWRFWAVHRQIPPSADA